MRLLDKIEEEMEEIIDLFNEVSVRDKSYFEQIEGEMLENQELLWIHLTKDRLHLKKKQAEELTYIYCVFWEYFKKRKNLSERKIDVLDFLKVREEYIEFVKYVGDEKNDFERNALVEADLGQVASKGLDACMICLWNDSKKLRKLGSEDRALFVINMRAFINCFDRLEPSS